MSIALQDLWQHLQRQLFPTLLQEVGDLGEKDRNFIEAVSPLPLGKFLEPYRWQGIGCPPHERAWIVHAFIAKSVYQFPTTKALIEALRTRPTLRRLCGYESLDAIPSESTFSRAFAQFAEDELPQRLHEALVKLHCGPKLVGHASHDATAIAVPERPPAPAASAAAARPNRWSGANGGVLKRVRNRRRRRPNGWTCSPTARWPKTWPTCPDLRLRAKKGSQGHMEYWRGYKLHLSVMDGDIPIAAILTSASTHDSQAAIPLMQMHSTRHPALRPDGFGL